MNARGVRSSFFLRLPGLALTLTVACVLCCAVAGAQEPAATEPAAPVPATAPAPESPPVAGEPTPAAAASAEPARTAEGSTSLRATSPARLADPIVARKLELSAEQQAAIAKLMAERATALAAADAAGRPALEAKSNDQLLLVLDESQRTRWQRLAREESRRLKFNFRFQPWADVLEWFAGQADLSLVLDAPPPGTFNYTDNREYTVPEAIDLINGVLLTKGYTLVRRDRMLMVLNIADGLPADLIPRVAADELDDRGRFELVSTVFPLAGRDAAEVETEIKPLLGPNGKTAILPKTRQLLVTDMAGKMRSIAAVIESIPTPDRGDRGSRGKPVPPELATYPLDKLTPATVLEVLKGILPDAKLVVDQDQRLLVTAPPEQQAAVATVLEQLRTNTNPADLPRLESYPVKQTFRAELSQILAPVAPGATFQIDSQTGHLLVFGTNKQHAVVERTLLQLGRQAEASDRKIEIYPLEKTAPAQAVAILSRLLPQTQVVIDSQANSIVVVGDAAEQQAVRETLERLEQQTPELDKRLIQIHPLSGNEPATLATILARLVPAAQVTLDLPGREALVVALPAEHDRIKGVLAQLANADAAAPEIKLYPIQVAQYATLSPLLTATAPNAQVTLDSLGKRLVVFARPEDHEKIAATLATLNEGTAALEPTLVVYPLNVSQSKKLAAVLTALAPELAGLRSVPDSETGHLSVWATPEQHQQVAQIMEQVVREVPESERARIEVYPIPDADPIALASMLQSLAPAARFSGDRQNGTLAVWGTPAEQELVKPAIESMLKRYPPGREPKLVVYRAEKTEIPNLLALLRSVVPAAQVAGDVKNGNLVAWGTAEEHGKIQATLDGLKTTSPEDELAAEVYSAPETDASTLLLVLQGASPDARLVPNIKANTVIAWARADEHAALKEAVKRLAVEPNANGVRSAKVYRFDKADANAALVVLRTLVPYAQLAVDTRTGNLAATALPSEHKLIEATVTQMEGEEGASDDFELRVYAIVEQDPTSALTIVRDLFAQRPEVRISLDPRGGKLVAWASPAQQDRIRTVLEGMQAAGAEADRRQVETYQLENVDAAAASNILTNLFLERRDVRIVPDKAGRTLTVMAPADAQATVKATLDQMRNDEDEFDVISLRVVDAYTASMSIRELFGDASDSRTPNAPRVDADPDAQQLIVSGSKQQLTKIRQLLTKMGEPSLMVDASGGGDRTLRVIPLGGRSAKSTLDEIERVWPQLRGNPIRVVTPSAVVPAMRAGRKSAPAPAGQPAPVVKPAVQPDLPLSPGEGGDEGAPPSGLKLPKSAAAPAAETELVAFAFDEPPATAVIAAEESAEQPLAEGSDELSVEAPIVADETADQPLAPIVIAPGEESITIASDDLEALNQFEDLFKAISQRHGVGGKEFTVFTLERADVMVVAQTLEQLFEGGSFGFRSSNVTIVPDQRLNALVVQGNRNELTTIEGLIEVLDTEDPKENLATRKPRMIPLKYASAVEVAEVIRDTYKTKLSDRGARQQSPRTRSSTRGVSRGLAALIDSLNSSSTGPEMTLSVDTATNSLIVLAAGPLFDEVKTLAETLDTNAGSGTRTVKVVPLTKTNSKAMQQTLKALFDTQGRRRPRE